MKDLTKGNITKQIWLFSLPLLASVIFQQLYNMADTIIAGNFINEEALAAVGASYPITMLFMAIALGCNLGCSVIVSRLFGEKNYKDCKEAISTILITVVILGIVLMGVGIGLATPLLKMINTPENIFKDSLEYFNVYMWGFGFILLYNVGTGIFSALGDSKTPLFFLIFSSVGNVILDLVFVINLHWGVVGLAFATFIAQGIAAILCIIYLLFKIRVLKSEKAHFFSKKLLLSMLVVAIPSVLQQSFISVGNMFIQNIVNNYGSSIIAGFTAAIKLNTFVVTSVTTVGGALSSFTAQNLGAHQIDRCKKGTNAAILMMFCIVIPFSIFYCACPDLALSLFMKEGSAEAFNIGRKFLYCVSPFYAIVSMKLMYDAILRGSANMRSFMVATFVDLIIRVVLCYVFDATMGIEAVWWSWPIGWVIAMIVSAFFYYQNKWYLRYVES